MPANLWYPADPPKTNHWGFTWKRLGIPKHWERRGRNRLSWCPSRKARTIHTAWPVKTLLPWWTSKIGHKWMFIVFIPPNHGIQGFNPSPKSIQVLGQSSCYHLLSFNRLTHFRDLATCMHSMPQEDPAQMDWYANSKDLWRVIEWKDPRNSVFQPIKHTEYPLVI